MLFLEIPQTIKDEKEKTSTKDGKKASSTKEEKKFSSIQVEKKIYVMDHREPKVKKLPIPFKNAANDFPTLEKYYDEKLDQAYGIIKNKKSESQEMEEKLFEFEESTFKINSTGWKEDRKFVYNSIAGNYGEKIQVKVNPTQDVIEYLEGPAKGEQIFLTYGAVIREVCKAKKCSKEEAEKKYLLTKEECMKKIDAINKAGRYNNLYEKEIKNHLAGAWSGITEGFMNLGEIFDLWVVNGLVGFNKNRAQLSGMTDFGGSIRLLVPHQKVGVPKQDINSVSGDKTQKEKNVNRVKPDNAKLEARQNIEKDFRKDMRERLRKNGIEVTDLSDYVQYTRMNIQYDITINGNIVKIKHTAKNEIQKNTLGEYEQKTASRPRAELRYIDNTPVDTNMYAQKIKEISGTIKNVGELIKEYEDICYYQPLQLYNKSLKGKTLGSIRGK